MANSPVELYEIPYERLLPWLRLFRSVRIASGASKLLLAALGLLLLHLGWDALDRLFPSSGPITPSALGLASHAPPGETPEDARSQSITPPLLHPAGPTFPEDRASIWADLQSAPWRITEPVRYLVGPFLGVFRAGSSWATFGHALATAVWGTLVWGFLGGTLCRMALAQSARSEGIGWLAAVRFSLRRSSTLAGVPLSPLILIAILTLLCLPIGLLYRIPSSAGPLAAGLLVFLPLLAGLVMAIVLLGLAFGWPLMPPAVAAEDRGGFEALSRSYGYVNQRRGYYLFLIVLAWLIGIAGLIAVDLIARLVVQLAHWALGFAAPAALLGGLFGDGTESVPPAAAVVHTYWLSFVGLLAHAWIYSYFWTSASIIYLLLRHSVDGTPIHALEWLDARREPPVVAGAPSSSDGSPGAETAGADVAIQVETASES